MSNLIEKAALRLEQLRAAGVDVPAAGEPTRPVVPNAPKAAQPAAPARVSKSVKIDLGALLKAGFVTPNAPKTVIADQYRVIKRPLLDNVAGKGAAPVAHANRIMVTSAMPGEGKSFTAINLAMSIAMELDYRVLLVDADVARPSLLKTFGLPASAGLLDLLEDDRIDLSQTLLRTNVDKLSLLPSGTPHPRATELLASDAMSSLIDEMGQRYPDRIIIFDSPPLLQTTESRVLATHMGQIVVVVQAGKTLQSQVQHALTTIQSCPVKMMVLNQAGARTGHGYGYGYGYGYDSDAAAGDDGKVADVANAS